MTAILFAIAIGSGGFFMLLALAHRAEMAPSQNPIYDLFPLLIVVFLISFVSGIVSYLLN